MAAVTIKKPAPGEDLLGILPKLLQEGDPGWRRRLSMFTGRALTDVALKNEQNYRAGRLTMLGQAVTPGTVSGLELSLNAAVTDPVVQVTPGFAIAAGGEAVSLQRALTTTLSTLQVINAISGLALSAFPAYTADATQKSFTGVLLLQPVTAQVNASAVDTGTGPIEVTGDLGTSCDRDPSLAAFEDSQLIDGVRLVMAAWPSTIALPDRDPAGTWRNRLVYEIFNAEFALAPGDQLPWAYFGAPLALIGFDTTWKPLFADRSAVVRAGGLFRRAYVLPAQPALPGAPLLVRSAVAQARITQLAEQIGQTPNLNALAATFAALPPAGILPVGALDLAGKKNRWFPANWSIKVAPIHVEEIETELDRAMKAAPFNLAAAEAVEVLLPLPDAAYDPNLLVTETVSPEFQQELNAANQALVSVVQHRRLIQNEANVLLQVLAQPALDLTTGLTAAEQAATTAPAVFHPDGSEVFGTESVPSADGKSTVLVSADIKTLQDTAAKSPYTVAIPGGSLPLFSAADWQDLATYGLQHFIDSMNAKLKRADDLLDLAFLTAQTDIYRFRQNVLGATDASRLATSPILANIATGETATATAANLRNYLASVTPPPVTPVVLTAAGAAPPPAPPVTSASANTAITKAALLRTANTRTMATLTTFKSPTVLMSVAPLTKLNEPEASRAFLVSGATKPAGSGTVTSSVSPVGEISKASTVDRVSLSSGLFQIMPTSGTTKPVTTSTEVQSQSPLVGAQIDIRTLSVAERLKQSPSQEGLFYAIANRLSILQILTELEITLDDLTFLVDDQTKTPAADTPNPTVTHAIAEMRTLGPTGPIQSAGAAAIFTAVSNPRLISDSDEAGVFSAGVRVLEQHTQLLRGVESRIAQYRDFLALCATALGNVQTESSQALTLLTQLGNDLAQARQNVAFIIALLADETARVAGVNAQRTQILSSIQVVVYGRPRTLETVPDVPSRQLVPGNIATPVPACLQQSIAIPPEVREIVNLLRDAPVNWMPAVEALLNRLENTALLHNLAVASQARATLQLQLAQVQSSARKAQGVYAVAIGNIQSANQQVFRNMQTERAAFQPAQIAQLNWTTQVAVLQLQAAVGDLISADSIHAEVVDAAARAVQQISSVAACLYGRAGLALPVARLEWAEFLRGPGLNIQLQSLAVLPNWNTQNYVDRQQMQLLVDWLFQQIDTTNPAAVAFMSDVVRVAILSAIHAPVDDIIAGAVTVRVKPVVGVVTTLTLPSERVSTGMYVQLFSAGALAAQAVVSDLSTTTVSATITKVIKPNVFLEANDIAHFTSQAPYTPALRAFARP